MTFVLSHLVFSHKAFAYPESRLYAECLQQHNEKKVTFYKSTLFDGYYSLQEGTDPNYRNYLGPLSAWMVFNENEFRLVSRRPNGMLAAPLPLFWVGFTVVKVNINFENGEGTFREYGVGIGTNSHRKRNIVLLNCSRFE